MDEYQSQLATVEQALSTTTDDDERVSLLSLRADLLELVDLTRQTIGLGENATAEESPADTMENEMLKFMNEIEQLERSPDEDSDQQTKNCSENDVETELLELQKQLESMVGQKCSAPHVHSWGSVAYHNAIICGIGDTDLEAEGTAAICLRVLFTNPTHREMLPCSYFLEGECRFDANNCHYSHGELVPFGELREYTEPNFEKLERNCVVLAKMQDRLWHKGRVLCSNFVEKICRVRLDDNKHKEKEMDFAFENLFPIFHDEDLSSDSSSDSDTDTEEQDELETAGSTAELENNLFTFSPNQPLGEWEKHTRGIGSKLMAKMGYVHGTGLGWNGKGIITPISAQVLPQGCSLDHCMNLREAANGNKDLFSVEMKLKRDKKKQDNINAKAYERETQRVDVFSFLNGTILNNTNTQNAAATKTSLQSKSTKLLNVESVRVADDIRKKTREIAKVEESMQRNAMGTEVHKRLQLQLDAKTQELNMLKKAEHSLAKEQTTRKTREKLCVF